jgi:two-component system, response regulator
MDTARDVRILLVDDDAQELEITLDALRRRGLGQAVHVARGGQEALDFLFGRGQFHNRRRHPLPDLVLLDLNMQAVDGFKVLRLMKECEELRRIPVIVLCTSVREGRRAMAGSARPNDYLVKPLSRDSFAGLSRRIRNWNLRLDFPDAFERGEDEAGRATGPPKDPLQAASRL